MIKSKLTTYVKKSPNNSGKRTEDIIYITPHCVVGHMTVENLGAMFARKKTAASSNYGIDDKGHIGLYVSEDARSWCSSSSYNDQRAITIECASDTKSPYKMSGTVYKTLVKLCVDILKRYKKKKLIWMPDRTKALKYKPKKNEMVITVHRWYANKACPGEWLYNRLGDLAKDVTKAIKEGAKNE